MRTKLFVLLMVHFGPVAFAAGAPVAPTDFFVLWQGRGAWQCTLTIEAGTLGRAEPYMFLDAHDRIERSGSQRVTASTQSRGNAAGLHVFVAAESNCTMRLVTNRATAEIALSDLPAHDAKVVALPDGKGFLLFGRGDPAPGPRDYYRANLPQTFVPPTHRHAFALPAVWWRTETPVCVGLAASPPGELSIRRVAHNEGLLYLEVYSPAGPLQGKAEITLGAKLLGAVEVNGSLWLSLEPRLGRIGVTLATPGGTRTVQVPATLVEVRGRRLFLNGAPFLIKGTLPGDLPPDDAEFIRSLGMNTLRGGAALEPAERYGFMAIASIQGRSLRKLSDYRGERGREEMARDLAQYYQAKAEHGRVAADSPYTLVTQLDNERTTIGANPLSPEGDNTGADPWSDYLKGETGEFVRLNRILAAVWNLVKPMAPMLPLGYANETQGYIAPAFLDVYLHNSYLPRDRYSIPFREFSRLQGGERRPFINTEYGANRFTPEAYHGAKNSPLLEKLQAWGYRQTWAAFMDAGTIGGTSYKLYDSTRDTDQGTKNFGIMTADRQPKLACWDIWHLWRDFEIAPAAGNARAVAVTFKRDYPAEDCRLTIQHDGQEWTTDLGDVAPNARRTVPVPFAAAEFRWRVDCTTHRGLKALATGAWPAALEEADFAQRLAQREAPGFLRELLTARVLTVQGQEAPPALVDMADADGVIPLAFQCADGTVYVTAFSRRRAGDTHYVKANLRTVFTGEVVKVAEWTGMPLAVDVPREATANGIVFKGVDVPIIPGPIGQRSNEPVSLPVFRLRTVQTVGRTAPR